MEDRKDEQDYFLICFLLIWKIIVAVSAHEHHCSTTCHTGSHQHCHIKHNKFTAHCIDNFAFFNYPIFFYTSKMLLRTWSSTFRSFSGQKPLLLSRICGIEHILKEIHSNAFLSRPTNTEFSTALNISNDLNEIFKFKDTNISNWIVEVRVVY